MCGQAYHINGICRSAIICFLITFLASCVSDPTENNITEVKNNEAASREGFMGPATESGVIVGSPIRGIMSMTGVGIAALAKISNGFLLGSEFSGGKSIERKALIRRTQTNRYEVKLMVRDFLISNKREYPYYGYYSYLIFSERTEENADHRKAAANAFICQFQGVYETSIAGLSMEDFAVFYAPVKKTADIVELQATESAAKLLEDYDYAYALSLTRLLAPKYSFGELSVAIIACPIPLGDHNTKLDLDLIQVLNLSNKPPSHIAKMVSEFRKALAHPTEFKDINLVLVSDPFTGEIIEQNTIRTISLAQLDTDRNISLKLKQFFGSIGKLVFTIAPDAHAEDFSCE